MLERCSSLDLWTRRLRENVGTRSGDIRNAGIFSQQTASDCRGARFNGGDGYEKMCARRSRGPFPDLVRQIDSALAMRSYPDHLWVEVCGAALSELWAEYLDYHE